MSSRDNKSHSEFLIAGGTKRPHVGVLVASYRGYGQSLISGIIRYAQQYGPWDFVYYPSSTMDINALERFAPADGLMVEVRHSEMKKAIKALKKPTVAMLGSDWEVGFPHVMIDNVEVGRMAAKYFLNQGFDRFAFVGGGWGPVQLRKQGFLEGVEGRPVSELFVDEHQPLGVIRDELKNWLAGIPKPVGLLAAHMIDAPHIMEMCHELGVLVPEQVSVLSVDNDPLFCQLTTPPLSSIDPATRRVGFEAANLLDRMLAGQSVSLEPLIVPPKGIDVRQSSDTLAIDHPAVARALRVIRRQAIDGLNVEKLLRQVPVCRRTLESQFRRILGRSVHQEIVRVRVEEAKTLLGETDMDMIDIAIRCGFSYASQMTALFKKHTGQTPKAFRQARRIH